MKRTRLVFALSAIGIASIAPTTAGAANTVHVLQAPFASTSISESSGNDGTPLSHGSSLARATVAGDVTVGASASSGNPAGAGVLVGGAFGKGNANIHLQPVQLNTGRVRITATLSGGASARSQITAGIASGSVGVAMVQGEQQLAEVGTGSNRFVLAEDQASNTGPWAFTGEINTTPEGYCPAAPVSIGYGVSFTAHATATLVSKAEARGDVRLNSIIIEELPCEPEPPRANVSIVDFAFSPDALTVAPGTHVRWQVDGCCTSHTVASDGNAFPSRNLCCDESYTVVFDEPGTYPYHCEIHPDQMTGVIEVQAT